MAEIGTIILKMTRGKLYFHNRKVFLPSALALLIILYLHRVTYFVGVLKEITVVLFVS